jgi:hypothetical protein
MQLLALALILFTPPFLHNLEHETTAICGAVITEHP